MKYGIDTRCQHLADDNKDEIYGAKKQLRQLTSRLIQLYSSKITKKAGVQKQGGCFSREQNAAVLPALKK